MRRSGRAPSDPLATAGTGEEPAFERLGFGPQRWSAVVGQPTSWWTGIREYSTPAVVLGALLILMWVIAASPPTSHAAISLGLLLLSAAGGRWRWAAGVAVAVIYGLLGFSIVVGQYLDDHRADFDWPAAFAYAHSWGVVVMVVCGGLGALDVVRSARSARSAGDGEKDERGVVDLVGEVEVPAVE